MLLHLSYTGPFTELDSFMSNEHTIIKDPAMDMSSADSLALIIAKAVGIIFMHEANQ